MATIIQHDLPTTIEIGGATLPVTWDVSGDMGGFTGATAGIPMDKYKSSDDAEREIWEAYRLRADVFADGTATLTYTL